DLGAIEDAGECAVLADDLDGVPFADGLDRLLPRCPVIGERALRAADGKDLAHIAVHALDLDTLGPDLVRARDVDETATVAAELRIVRQPLRPDVFPLELEVVVLEALLGGEVAIGLASAVDLAAHDFEGVVLDTDRLEAGKVLAVEQRCEALV